METVLIVQNLKCHGCGNTIKKELQTLPGLHDIMVNPEKSQVSFVPRNEDQILEVKNSLKALGYPVLGTPNSFKDKALSFVSCSKGKFGG